MPVTVELPDEALSFEFDDSYSNDQIAAFLKRAPWRGEEDPKYLAEAEQEAGLEDISQRLTQQAEMQQANQQMMAGEGGFVGALAQRFFPEVGAAEPSVSGILGGAAAIPANILGAATRPVLKPISAILGGATLPFRLGFGSNPLVAMAESQGPIIPAETLEAINRIHPLTRLAEETEPGRQFFKTLAERESEFTTPEAITSAAALGLAGPEAVIPAGLAFGAPQAIQGIGQITEGDVGAGLANLGVGGGMALAPFLMKEGGPRARSIEEATEVYGDVLRRTGEGTQKVPAQEGGARVHAPEEVGIKLSAADADLLERHAIDVPIEVVDAAREGDPFARSQAGIDYMYADRENGRVAVPRGTFERAMAILRDRGFTEEQLRELVKSGLEEEVIHLRTPDELAKTYWDSLSRLEQWINKNRYAEYTEDLTSTELGHEALRFRIQQAQRMTPREFLEMTRTQRWTWKGLTALEKAIRGIRELFGSESRTLFDRALENINVVKEVAGRSRPAARLREEQELPELLPGDRIVTVLRPDGTTYQAAFGDKYYDLSQIGRGRIPSIAKAVEGKWSHGMLGPGEKILEPSTPAARLRKSAEGQRRLELGRFGEEPEVRPGAPPPPPEAGRLKITPVDLDWNQPGKQGTYRPISDAERANPRGLAEIITEDSHIGGSRTKKSMTRRLTVLQDTRTGEVHIVSTYPHGRSGALLVDPQRAGAERPNEPLQEILDRGYRPLYTMLRDSPVKNFHQRFNSLADFQTRFGEEARQLSRESLGKQHLKSLASQATKVGAEEISARTEIPEGVQEPAVYSPEETRRYAPNADEVSAFHEYFEGNMPATPRAFVRTLEKAAASRGNRLMTEALRKAMIAEQVANPDITPDAALDRALTRFYENLTSSETRSQFVERTIAQIAPETLEAIPRERAAGETGRELATLSRQEAIARGGAPVLSAGTVRRSPRPEPERYLSPEARAELEAGIEQRAAAEQARRAAEQERVARSTERQRVETKTEAQKAKAKMLEEAKVKQTLKLSAPAARLRTRRNLAGHLIDNVIFRPAHEFAIAYSSWLSDTVRRYGGERGKQASAIFNKIIDREKEILGDNRDILNKALVATGGSRELPLVGQVPSPSKMRATAWLSGIDKQWTPDTFTARNVGAVEGTLAVPPEVQKVVTPQQDANLRAGQLRQPVTPHFTPRNLYERHYTAYGFDLLRAGLDNETTRKVANGTLAANRGLVKRRTIVEYYRTMHEELSKEVPDMAKIEKTHQDYVRRIPNVITHVRTPMGIQEIIHTQPFNYVQNTMRQAAATRAFREQFPMNPAGQRAFADLSQGVRTALPAMYRPAWDTLVRVVQGRPGDNYNVNGWMAPGKTIPEVFRFFNQTLMRAEVARVLSGQMVTQLAEFGFGGTAQFLGMRNMLEATLRLPELWNTAEMQGQVNRALYDWSFQQHAKLRSTFRIGSNLVAKLFAENFLNELQGRQNAIAAQIVAGRIQSGRLSSWERRRLPETLRMMQFSEPEVNLIMSGDPAMLNQFQRRAPAWLSTENRLSAEGSRMSTNRLLNSIFRFQAYPMMKANHFRQAWLRFTDAKTGRQKALALEGLAREIFYTSAQGAALTAVASFVFGGPSGFKVWLHEAKDEPFKFWLNSFMTSFGGPLYFVYQGARYRGLLGVGEGLSRMIFPWSIGNELVDVFNQSGQYRDMTLPNAIGKYVMEGTPGMRMVRGALSTFGLGQIDLELETAIRGYSRWARGEFGTTDFNPHLKQDERREFRTAMREAVRALQTGDGDGYAEAMGKAVMEAAKLPQGKREISPGDRIASSLRARKILQGPNLKELTPEQRESVLNRIGDDAYLRLLRYDAQLEAIADSIAE